MNRPITLAAAVLILISVANVTPAQSRLPPLKILKSPSPEVLAGLFPATASRAGVEGAATLECVIRRDGTFGECTVRGENPEGLGFGGAALVAMTYYKIDVAGPNTVQVSRRMPGITIRFALPAREGGGALDAAHSGYTYCIYREAAMTKTTLFQSNRTQAVRLPKGVAFPDGVKSVTVLREGSRRVIVPSDVVWDDFFVGPGVDLGDREQPEAQFREPF